MLIAVLSSFTPSLFWFRADMMRSFREAGWDVLAVGDGAEGEWASQFAELGIRYRAIPVRRNGLNPVQDLVTLRALYRLLKEEKPDRIFAYQAKTVIYGGIAAGLCGIREFYPLIAGVGSVFLGDSPGQKLLRGILAAEYRLGMGRARKVFFQNRDDLKIFVDHGIVQESRAVMLRGSGVNIEVFRPAPLPEQPGFLCISRLIRDKGVREYLDAARKLRILRPEVSCVLVGPYDTNPSALRPEELQPYLEDGSVTYVGEQKDVRPWLKACTAYVLPSYHEGTPKTVLEAMACGRPAITTDAPGCRETVTDGVNGYLVPVKDADAIVEAMERILDEPETTKRMASEARRICEERYDVRKVNHTILMTMGIGSSSSV